MCILMLTGKKLLYYLNLFFFVVVVVKKVIIKNLCVEFQNYYKKSADSIFIQKAGPNIGVLQTLELWQLDFNELPD